jgi:hypothetical protein
VQVSESEPTGVEPRVVVEYERDSIHYGDDPLPLKIQFPPRTTITDLLVAFAENQTRYFAYRRGLSTWMLWHIPDREARRVIGLVQFDNNIGDVEQTLVFVLWGDPYWGRPLTEELLHQSNTPMRIKATSAHGGQVATVRRWNSYTAAVPLSVAERPWGSA